MPKQRRKKTVDTKHYHGLWQGTMMLYEILTGKSTLDIEQDLNTCSAAGRLQDLRKLSHLTKPNDDLTKSEDGEILMWVIKNKREDVHFLIQQGIDLNFQDEDGMTQLSWAARHSLTEGGKFC
jgi:ankyrin repeat protein